MSIGDGIKAHIPAIPLWGWGVLAGGGVLIYMAHRGSPHAAAALDPNNAYPAGTAADAASGALDAAIAQGQSQLALQQAQNQGQLALVNAGGAIQHQQIMDQIGEAAGIGQQVTGLLVNSQNGSVTWNAPDGTSVSVDNTGYWQNQVANTQGNWANVVAGQQGYWKYMDDSATGYWGYMQEGQHGYWDYMTEGQKGYWTTQNTAQQGTNAQGLAATQGYWDYLKALIPAPATTPVTQPLAQTAPALVGGNTPALVGGNPPASTPSAPAQVCNSGNFSCVRYACPRGNYSCANSVAPWLNGQNPGW